MGLFENEDTTIEKLKYSPTMIRNVIVGYRESSKIRVPLVLILPQIFINSQNDGYINDFEDVGISLYPKSKCFDYGKSDYIASLVF